MGRVVEEASTDTIFTKARHPCTQALLQSVLAPEPVLGVPDSQLGPVFANLVVPPSG
jgi:peptide/nickel transport system ATP-binding protein